MTEFAFTCRDDHIDIGFDEEPPNGDERCPLCLLRDRVLLEIAQPRAGDGAFVMDLSSRALQAYPFDWGPTDE